MIQRTIGPHVLKLAKMYPIVTVTGPRQSGKTTLVRMLFPDFDYVNLLLASGRDLIPIEIKSTYTPADDLSKGVRHFTALTQEARQPTVIYAGRNLASQNNLSFCNFEDAAAMVHALP